MATLDYSSPSPRKRRRVFRKLLVTLTLVYIAIAVAFPSGHGYYSICTDCGLIEDVDEHYLPFTSITIHRSRHFKTTAVSSLLTKHNFRANHQHQFSFGSGNEYGPFRWTCELGIARHIRMTCEDSNVASFLDAIIKYADTRTASLWLDVFLDPQASDNARFTVYFSNFVSTVLPNRSAFDNWYSTQAPQMIDYIKSDLSKPVLLPTTLHPPCQP